jgi:hypothetical protein
MLQPWMATDLFVVLREFIAAYRERTVVYRECTQKVDAYTDETQDQFGHDTRISDSSIYDEVCKNCGATDGPNDGRLNIPCPKK